MSLFLSTECVGCGGGGRGRLKADGIGRAVEAYEYVGDAGIGGSVVGDGGRESLVVAIAGLLILLYTAATT
jgi:hypothetical protein